MSSKLKLWTGLDKEDIVIVGTVLVVGCILAGVESFVWNSPRTAALSLLYSISSGLIGYPLIAYAGRRGWLSKEEKQGEIRLTRAQISIIALFFFVGTVCAAAGVYFYFVGD